MWAVVRTKPNQEIRAKINLENQGFSTYLPILNQKKFYRGKWTDFRPDLAALERELGQLLTRAAEYIEENS